MASIGRLKRNIDYIKILSKATPKQCKAIIQTADADLILCLCECVLNLLEGNIKVSPKTLNELQRHKKPLRDLVDKSVSKSDKKKILEQKGGFLPALLIPVLSAASSLLVDALIRK